MEKYARLAAADDAEFIDMARPKSNFDFIDLRFRELVTLRRLFSLVREHGGRTIVVERLKQSSDVQEENQDIRLVCSGFSQSRVFRLSFFSQFLSDLGDLGSATDDDLIGYVLVKDDVLQAKHVARIYESVLRDPRRPNSFVKRQPLWEIRVGQKLFRIRGHVYAQQNSITNCCGHVAVRTAAACFGKREMSYRQMNKLLGVNLRTRKLSDGIGTDEMVKLLRAAGAKCFQAEYGKKLVGSSAPPSPFQKYVYGCVESGYPAIISFRTATSVGQCHAIPVFGHTFDSDTWVPSADRLYFGAPVGFLSSESWVNTYIGHDDNWGSHFSIPRHYFQTQHPPEGGASASSPDTECVVHVIATCPRNIRVSPIRAEAMGADYLLKLKPTVAKLRRNIWAGRLYDYARRNLLVLRPVLVRTDDYCSHLRRIRDWHHSRIDERLVWDLETLPSQWLWMIEVSVPELFSTNRRKLGEIILPAQKKPGKESLKDVFFARLPGYFALLREIKNGKPRFRFIPSGADGHVELFGCEDDKRQ